MKDLNPASANPLALIDLLQEIVASFSDADSRPNDKIVLYEKYRELQKTHTVNLAGRFIVISGNRKGRVRRARSRTQVRQAEHQLHLAPSQRNRQSGAATASKA